MKLNSQWKMKIISNVKDINGYISLPMKSHISLWLGPKWRIYTSHTYKILRWDMPYFWNFLAGNSNFKYFRGAIWCLEHSIMIKLASRKKILHSNLRRASSKLAQKSCDRKKFWLAPFSMHFTKNWVVLPSLGYTKYF